MEIKIKTEFIKLDQLLKYIGAVETGGDAKQYILDGEVKVNDEIEIRRGRKIYSGDKVEIFGKTYVIK